jgi:hyperosmotically inducible protein
MCCYFRSASLLRFQLSTFSRHKHLIILEAKRLKEVQEVGMAKTSIMRPLIPIILLAGLAETALASGPTNKAETLADEVRHQLILLPYYSVFDNLEFTIKDQDTVLLTGQVTWPAVKSDAEAAVRSIKGVRNIENNIEILPVSRFDDSIRWATYRAIFSRPGFEKYAIQAVSPIRIIVRNGNVTLEGYIGSQLDKTMADMAANSVPGVFSVTDNLKIG